MEHKQKGMDSTRTCTCEADEVILLPCAGGSNCGQIANQVAVQLDQEGVGRLYCLAGVGAHISGMIESVRSAKRVMAIDGCSLACAKKTVEHAGLMVTDWLCVTDEGIEKNHEFTISEAQISMLIQRAKEYFSS